MEKSNCPLSEKCSYYKEFKADPSKLKDCPATKGCPHYQKGHHDKSYNHEDAAKCPHLASVKKTEKAAGKPKAEEHDEL